LRRTRRPHRLCDRSEAHAARPIPRRPPRPGVAALADEVTRGADIPSAYRRFGWRQRIDKPGFGAAEFCEGFRAERFEERAEVGPCGEILQLFRVGIEIVDFFRLSGDERADVFVPAVA